jgi:hypothetical protein
VQAGLGQATDSSVPSDIARVQQAFRQGLQLAVSSVCHHGRDTYKTQPQGIRTQLFPFRFSKQIVQENAVCSNDECSCVALYAFSSVWNVDTGKEGGTDSLLVSTYACTLILDIPQVTGEHPDVDEKFSSADPVPPPPQDSRALPTGLGFLCPHYAELRLDSL